MSDFFFPTPGFLSGAARTADFWGVLDQYNTFPTGPEADRIAAALDWAEVGADLRFAMDNFDQGAQESVDSE